MSRHDVAALWQQWRLRSEAAACKRWVTAHEQTLRRKLNEKEWLKEIKTQLTHLEEMHILGFRQAARLTDIPFNQLGRSDQDRITRTVRPRYLYAIGLTPTHGFLTCRDSDRLRLRQGQLSLQIFIDTHTGHAAGMNIQLRGQDQLLQGRGIYLRYDLDLEQMGSGPVTHFRAHWHCGAEPGAKASEDTDPRLPAPILDPQDVLDVLIETFFAAGPGAALPPGGTP